MVAYRLIQLFCLRTQFPPFVSLYRLYYKVVAFHFVRSVARLDGVRAVYQVGGMADQPVYGLSDIDLIVFVQEESQRDAVLQLHGRLFRRYKVLASADEIGLYVASEFKSLFQAYPFFQHRFGGDSNARLLWGKADLEGTRYTFDKAIRIESRLFYLWDAIRKHFIDYPEEAQSDAVSSSVGRLFRSFLWYKVFSELGSAILYLQSSGKIPKRDRALDLLGDGCDPVAAAALSDLLECSGDPRIDLQLSFQQGWEGVHTLLGRYFEHRSREGEARPLDLQVIEINGERSPVLDPSVAQYLNEHFLIKDSPRLIPALYFSTDIRGPIVLSDGCPATPLDNDPLRLDPIDQFLLLIPSETLPSQAVLRELQGQLARTNVLDALIVRNEIGYSVLLERSPWALIHPRTHPEIFALKSTEAVGAGPRSLFLPRERCDQIMHNYASKGQLLNQLVRSGGMDHWTESELSRVLIQTLECRAVLAAAQADRFIVPHSSDQLAEQLVGYEVISEAQSASRLIRLGQSATLRAEEREEICEFLRDRRLRTNGEAE